MSEGGDAHVVSVVVRRDGDRLAFDGGRTSRANRAPLDRLRRRGPAAATDLHGNRPEPPSDRRVVLGQTWCQSERECDGTPSKGLGLIAATDLACRSPQPPRCPASSQLRGGGRVSVKCDATPQRSVRLFVHSLLQSSVGGRIGRAEEHAGRDAGKHRERRRGHRRDDRADWNSLRIGPRFDDRQAHAQHRRY